MAIAKTNGSFFRNHKEFINDQCAIGSQPIIKPLTWFSQMARDENLKIEEVCDVLGKMEDFLDKKEFEKAETMAELQLAYAFQDMLEEKRVTLSNSKIFKCRLKSF